MRLSLLLSLLLCLVAGPAQATGPSTAYVKLFPLAARNGAVLFRTQWEVNVSGSIQGQAGYASGPVLCL
jgi:hypothetical protein